MILKKTKNFYQVHWDPVKINIWFVQVERLRKISILPELNYSPLNKKWSMSRVNLLLLKNITNELERSRNELAKLGYRSQCRK